MNYGQKRKRLHEPDWGEGWQRAGPEQGPFAQSRPTRRPGTMGKGEAMKAENPFEEKLLASKQRIAVIVIEARADNLDEAMKELNTVLADLSRLRCELRTALDAQARALRAEKRAARKAGRK